MRKILFTVLVMLALCRVCLAIGWQEVPCDSTSYIYYYTGANGSGLVALPDEPKTPQVPVRILFHLPYNYLSAPNPEYQTVKHDKLEFYVRLRPDNTSAIYLSNVYRLSRTDSLTMFLPFDNRNIDDYTVKQFGIKAMYVDLRKPLPPHFHIDISGEQVREQYPWGVVFPVILGVVLVLLAMFFQDGYISRIFNVVVYHNVYQHRMRERNVNADKSGGLLFANYIVNAALFAIVVIYRYDLHYKMDFSLMVALLAVAVLAVYLIKALVSVVLANLFNCRDIFNNHYHNVSYVMQATGVFLLVMNILSLYIDKQGIHDFVFFATLIGCSVAEILKIFRLIKIIIDKHFSYFYLFLYLCGVEILPVLLAVKILSH